MPCVGSCVVPAQVSIAADNGRTREFLHHVEYPDKSRCFECVPTPALRALDSKLLAGSEAGLDVFL